MTNGTGGKDLEAPIELAEGGVGLAGSPAALIFSVGLVESGAWKWPHLVMFYLTCFRVAWGVQPRSNDEYQASDLRIARS